MEKIKRSELVYAKNYIDGHTQEVVSYLAIHYPETSSSIISNFTQIDGTSVAYDIRLFDIDSDDSAPILGTSYYLQEEQSDDNEIKIYFKVAESILSINDEMQQKRVILKFYYNFIKIFVKIRLFVEKFFAFFNKNYKFYRCIDISLDYLFKVFDIFFFNLFKVIYIDNCKK